jgi:hypothetical protein
MSPKVWRRIPESGVYVVRAAEGLSRSVPAGTEPAKRPAPDLSEADKQLAAAVWEKRSG